VARQGHNAAFVVGSILGGVAGAAAALWKAPLSGPELRAKVTKVTGGSTASTVTSQPAASSRARSVGGGSSVGGKVLSFVENATAPIVGVKLGQTAREVGSRTVNSVRPGSRPTTTPTGDSVLAPHESTGETRESGVGHVASTEELVKPMVPVETQSATQATGPLTEFPRFDADERKD